MSLTAMALEAGVIAERTFEDGLKIETKSNGTPVTNADRAVCEYLMDACTKHHPQTAYLGEEGQAGPKGAHTLISVDEIDGTGAFKNGQKDCSIVLGYAHRWGDIIVFEEAVINNFRDEGCFTAWAGGIWLTRPGEAIQSITMAKRPEGHCPKVNICAWPSARHNLFEAEHALRYAGFEVTHPGGVAVIAGRIITGDVDCVLFPGESNFQGGIVKNSWHEAGPMEFMISAAGGTCTDFTGNKLMFDEVMRPNGYPDFLLRCGFVASYNKDLHAEILRIIQPFIDR